MITITIPGQPIAKGRPRFSTAGRFPRAFTPAKTQNYEAWIKSCAADVMDGQPLLTGPVKLRVYLFMEIAKSWPAWKKQAALSGVYLPTSKPDADNVIKALKDALNGIVWKDDSQIYDLWCGKFYDQDPRVELQIKETAQICSAAEWKNHELNQDAA